MRMLRTFVGITLAMTMLSAMAASPASAVVTGSGGALLTDDAFAQTNP